MSSVLGWLRYKINYLNMQTLLCNSDSVGCVELTAAEKSLFFTDETVYSHVVAALILAFTAQTSPSLLNILIEPDHCCAATFKCQVCHSPNPHRIGLIIIQ